MTQRIPLIARDLKRLYTGFLIAAAALFVLCSFLTEFNVMTLIANGDAFWEFITEDFLPPALPRASRIPGVLDSVVVTLALAMSSTTIAAILALVFVLAAGIWAYTGVTGSYYLGTYQGNVAVWRGLPGKPLGLKLHWLESETSIKLSDLPEDTQNRLKAGIPQTSVDDAQDTISKYRHQIDEEQTRQVIDAQTIRDNTNQGSTSESDSEKTAEQSAEAEASDKN